MESKSKVEYGKEVVLKVESDDQVIKLVCDESCSLGKLWDALIAFQGEVLGQIKANTPNQAPEEEECQDEDKKSDQEA